MGIKIFYNNKFISPLSREHKYSENELKTIEKSTKLPTTPVDFIKLFDEFDAVYVEDLDDISLINRLLAMFELVNADGGVVRNENRDLLMIFRNGFWDLPKGKRESGESSVECAKREVEEECGIDVDIVGEKICDTYHIYNMFDKWIIKRTSWYDMLSSDNSSFIPQIEEGITEIKWVKAEDIESYYSKTHSTIEHILQIWLAKSI